MIHLNILISSLTVALLITGCAGPKIYTSEESEASQSYNGDWSRAHNLLGLFHSDADKLQDGHYLEPGKNDNGVFTGRVTGVLAEDTFRVKHLFGFLPADSDMTPEQASRKVSESGLDALRALFISEGFSVVDAEPLRLSSGGSTRYSFFIAKEGSGCTLPKEHTDLEDVNEQATCRIDLTSSRFPPTKGNSPTDNGFTVIPKWAGVVFQHGWRIVDTRLSCKIWITADSPTNILTNERLERLTMELPDGFYLFFLHEKTGEPFVGEKGKVLRFIEPRTGMEKRVKAERDRREALSTKLNDSIKHLISPR